jgi:hypothetical protein
MNELATNLALADIGRPSGVAGLRWDAVMRHDCPWCLSPAGTICIRKGTKSDWSSVPHDVRIDLALAAKTEMARQWGLRAGRSAERTFALAVMRSAIDKIEANQ